MSIVTNASFRQLGRLTILLNQCVYRVNRVKEGKGGKKKKNITGV